MRIPLTNVRRAIGVSALALAALFALAPSALATYGTTSGGTATLTVSSVVCASESSLPNWANTTQTITPSSAADYVASHPGCRVESGRVFQWGYGDVPGQTYGVRPENIPASFVGLANGAYGQGTNTGTAEDDWKTITGTNASGVATISIPIIGARPKFWVRTVIQAGDLAFSGSSNSTSAEIRCTATDPSGIYRNYDYAYYSDGGSYSCIAFNVAPVAANRAPTVTLTGASSMTLAQGTTFADLGCTASDPEDGDITSRITKTGTVNTAVAGTYTVTCNVTDSQGLAATPVSRTVVVTAGTPSTNHAPVLSLVGASSMTVTLGTAFTDPGCTATDVEEGNITSRITKTGTVNTAVAGTYTITCNVTDSQGLAATPVSRTVTVVAANTPPVLSLVGSNYVSVSVGNSFADTGTLATDKEDGVITQRVARSVTVQTPSCTSGSTCVLWFTENGWNIPVTRVERYTYTVTDSQGLAATPVVRTVIYPTACADGIDNDGDGKTDYPNDPGCSSADDTNETDTATTPTTVYVCSDGIDNDGDGRIDYPNDPGCSSPSDGDENTPPYLSLNGSSSVTITQGSWYTDPGATASDYEDGNITNRIVASGSVNPNVVGSYTFTYMVSDSRGLPATPVTRTINVVPASVTRPACNDGMDNDGDGLVDYPSDLGCTSYDDNDESGGNRPPVLTLVGSSPLIVPVGSTYTDLGCTAYDPEEGNITGRITRSGSVDASQVGTYTLWCYVNDAQGLAATPVARTVQVVGQSTRLIITNERIVPSEDGTSATITWNTNVPADSRMAWDTSSHPSSGPAPMYGYPNMSTTDPTMTTSHTMIINGLNPRLNYFFRPISATGSQQAAGIELARSTGPALPEACNYLREYMRADSTTNNPEEVKKLQRFLRDFEGFTTLQDTGVFGPATDAAVKAFQERYRADVLTPWKIPSPTGYVYYTTQKKINEIYCQRTFPLSAAQLAEIATYGTTTISRTGTTTSGTSSTTGTTGTTAATTRTMTIKAAQVCAPVSTVASVGGSQFALVRPAIKPKGTTPVVNASILGGKTSSTKVTPATTLRCQY